MIMSCLKKFRKEIKAKLWILEVCMILVFIIGGVFAYIYVEDNDGRDMVINLHDGFILESMNSRMQYIIYWDYKKEMEIGDGERILIKGNLNKYSSTDQYIVIYDKKRNEYICIDKNAKDIIKTSEKLGTMKKFVYEQYGSKSLCMINI